MRHASVFALLALWAGMALAADPSTSLTARQTDAKKQQAELRADIESLQKEIDQQESSRDDAAHDLKESESAISSINRRLADLEAQKRSVEHELRELDQKIDDKKKEMTQRQQQLSDQLRAQYASGLSPWTALLSGDDPQAIGRDLSYLGYISVAQADMVRAVRRSIDELAALQDQAGQRRHELDRNAQETHEKKEALEGQKKEHERVLARIDVLLQKQRTQAVRLKQNDKRLGQLIDGLEAAIAEQAERERLAAERRRAEAARKAELARKAAQEQRVQIERQREAAREADRQARAAQARAQSQHEAAQARIQVEQAREQARATERAAQAQAAQSQAAAQAHAADSAHAAAAESRPGPLTAPAAPPGGFSGLKKGLPLPVKGEVQGRFGAERPDGGLWRGIVLRAPEGLAVHAVAAGRVVYASWLSGFGNIMIIDHGAKYLSVYAYNQSLLKSVGDIIQSGQTIATVGATGGQVEPGLYFEIRHQGSPVNPLLWLRH